MSAMHQPPDSATAALPLSVWGATDKGRRREGNEDAVFPHSGSDTFPFVPGPQHLAQRGQLLVVADGVGGARAGREASHWAIRVAVERYYDAPGLNLGANLQAAIEQANASLYQYLQSTGTREAGCTMAAAVIHGDMLYVANVGDSRVYLLRGGQITRRTVDHTLAQQKLAHGIITPEEAKSDPGSHVLTRSLGAAETVHVDLFPPIKLVPGDVVLLCSDGLTDMVDDEEIARLIDNHPPRKAAQRLIAAANRNGGLDNISVVVARVGGEGAQGEGIAGWWESLEGKQKAAIAGLAGLIVLVMCALVAAVSYAYYEGRREPTPMPTATAYVVPVTPEATVAPTDTPPPPTDTVPAGQPTSTPRPTSTPTPTFTPVPPTRTPLPTDTPTPTPTSSAGGGGGGGQPKPTSPPPTNPPPTNPPPTSPPATDTPQPR